MEKDTEMQPQIRRRISREKKQEITNWLEARRQQIEAGELVVLFLDECHLLWGDICGYVWGKTNERVEVPVLNQRQKQTYYGALNFYTQKFMIKAYDQGNSQSTIAFLQYLGTQYPKSRIALIWDGASYHRSYEVKTYLESVNQHLQPLDWQITCIRFAPNAPAQNPALRCVVTSKTVYSRVLSSV